MVHKRALRGRNPTLNPTFPILGPYTDEHRFFHCCRGPMYLPHSWECAFAKSSSPGPVSRFCQESIVFVVLVTGEEKEARGQKFCMDLFPCQALLFLSPVRSLRGSDTINPCPTPNSIPSVVVGAELCRTSRISVGTGLLGHVPPDSLFPHCPILV